MKLSRIVTGLLAVALVAFMVSDTLGQEEGRRGRGGPGRGGPGGGFQRGPGGPGGGPGGGFGRGGDITLGLLRVEEVRAELQIAPDQEEALTKLAEQARPERPDADFRSMSEEERTAFFEKMRKQMEEKNAEMKDQLIEVLLPEQMDRLDEIALQVRGVQALSDDEVAGKLKITDAQKKELDKVREDLQTKMRDQMRELFASGDRDKMQEAFGTARKEMEDGILAVLSKDQQAEFEKMKGDPFEMPEGFGRGGFGSRGGGGFGGPGGGRPGGGRPGGDGGGRRSRPQAENSDE